MQPTASQQILLVRHGETEWSLSGQHTGRTDIPLTPRGRQQAQAIGRTLVTHQETRAGRGLRLWSSPLSRALETLKLTGLTGGQAAADGDVTLDEDLLEWDYGVYEGRTTAEIRREIPDWSVWTSPITGGESVQQVGARAERVIQRAASLPDDVALFAHGHVLRILAACWVELPPEAGRLLALDTATVSILGYERETRVIRHWNLPPQD